MSIRSSYDVATSRKLKRIAYAVKSKPFKMTDFTGNEISVFGAFPYDPESKTAPATAKSWCQGSVWDAHAVKYVTSGTPQIIDQENLPITLKIVDLEARGNGGRAYKVVDSENRLFDLREDQLIDAIRYAGIQPGGTIAGTFVWGVTNSTTKLIFVGGELYNTTLEREKMDAAAKTAGLITGTKFVFGEMYSNGQKGEAYLYMGRAVIPGYDKKMFGFVKVNMYYNKDDSTRNDWNKNAISYFVQKDAKIEMIQDKKFKMKVGAFEDLAKLLDYRGKLEVTKDYQKLEEYLYEKNGGVIPKYEYANICPVGHQKTGSFHGQCQKCLTLMTTEVARLKELIGNTIHWQ